MSEYKYPKVEELVRKLYLSSDKQFSKWMWGNHVPKVAKFSETLTKKYKGNPDFSVAGAWLHDLADAFIDKANPKHEQVSLEKARGVLADAGYTKNEIETVIADVIVPHSCYQDNRPAVLEGKILATADALAHFADDFYLQLCWQHLPAGKSYNEFTAWVREKIERDYNVKISFDDERETIRGKYEALKLLFQE